MLGRVVPQLNWAVVVGVAACVFLVLAMASVRKSLRWTTLEPGLAGVESPHRRRWGWLWFVLAGLILLAPCIAVLVPYFAARTTTPEMDLIVRAIGIEERDDAKWLTMDFTTRFTRGRQVTAISDIARRPDDAERKDSAIPEELVETRRVEVHQKVIGTILEHGRTVDVRRAFWKLPEGLDEATIEAARARVAGEWVDTSRHLDEGRQMPVLSLPLPENRTFTAYLTVPARQSGRPVPTIQ
jgi:hypothetical protein